MFKFWRYVRKGAVKLQIKRLLRFYFSAESLDKALNNLILKLAVHSGGNTYVGGEACAEKIIALIGVKGRLSELWARLNGVLINMTEGDRATLKRYAASRANVNWKEKREIHRAVVKFGRRAVNLLNGGEDLYKILCAYAALLSPAPD